MRWITDFLVRTAVSYFSGRQQQQQPNYEALLYVGSLLVRRAIFVVVGALAAMTLLIGGLFMTLVDLGHHMNAFGSMGLTYSGGIGIILMAFSALALVLVYRTPVRIQPHELEMLRASQPHSMGEMLLAGLMDKFQGYMQGEPVDESARRPLPTTTTAHLTAHMQPQSYRPTGSMNPSGAGVRHPQDSRDWSAYSSSN